MENSTDVKRKCCFPAFDDETGVKLANKNKRVLFADEWQLTDYSEPAKEEPRVSKSAYDAAVSHGIPTQTVRSTNKETKPMSVKTRKPIKSSTYPEQINTGSQSYGQKSRMNSKKETKGLFTKSEAASNLPYREKPKKDGYRFETKPRIRPSASGKNIPSYNPVRSRFVPKYIPASHVHESEDTTVPQEELIQTLKKNKASYLLFEAVDAPFVHKKNEEDPTVSKFHKNPEASEIPVTRRQFQKLKSDVDLFSKKEQPAALNDHEKNQKNDRFATKKENTAYQQKHDEISNETDEDTKGKKKNPRLEKSLSGIMREEKPNNDSKYFD